MKLVDAQHHAQLLATFVMDNPLDFTSTNVMKLHAILEKLHKIIVVDTCDNHLFSRGVLSLGRISSP